MTESIKTFFIRPQRQTYYTFDLGPSIFFIQNKKCIRDDFFIQNKEGHKLTVSFFRFEQQSLQNCLIYLHTHNGSKLQAVPFIESIMSNNVNLCIFDFAGYGNSEGSTVSLGIKQIWDIEIIIQYLKSKYNQEKFILWGRSMGAVAALLYISMKMNQVQKSGIEAKQCKIIGGIYDSPFYSLQKLTLELGSKTSNIPQVLLSPVIYFLKSSLKQNLNFAELELLHKMKSIKVPGIFITSQNDNFVHYSHSQKLYKEYGGKKQLLFIERDHGQVRTKIQLEPVFEFIRSLTKDLFKKWQIVLKNNLLFNKKQGKTISSMFKS